MRVLRRTTSAAPPGSTAQVHVHPTCGCTRPKGIIVLDPTTPHDLLPLVRAGDVIISARCGFSSHLYSICADADATVLTTDDISVDAGTVHVEALDLVVHRWVSPAVVTARVIDPDAPARREPRVPRSLSSTNDEHVRTASAHGFSAIGNCRLELLLRKSVLSLASRAASAVPSSLDGFLSAFSSSSLHHCVLRLSEADLSDPLYTALEQVDGYQVARSAFAHAVTSSVRRCRRSEDVIVSASNVSTTSLAAAVSVAEAAGARVGAFIESPQPKRILRELARECELISFGTSDLTCRVLGITRPALARAEPAVLDSGAITTVVELLARHIDVMKSMRPGLQVNICGWLSHHEDRLPPSCDIDGVTLPW